jgi:MFS family permease
LSPEALSTDIPTEGSLTAGNPPEPFFTLVRRTFANRALMSALTFDLMRFLPSMAWPFYATYMLEKLGMPFLGVGLVNAALVLTTLISAPFWGRMVERYGCRPVLIACSFFIVPVPLVWIWIDTPARCYALATSVNLIQGFAASGIVVAIQTFQYKVTAPVGRSVQLAVYIVLVNALTAIMPTLGGLLPGALRQIAPHLPLPEWLRQQWLAADLRWTFYPCVLFLLGAAFAARLIREPGSHRTRELVRRLPGHVPLPGLLTRPGGLRRAG